MTRSVLYVLLPLAIILTIALVGQGAVQTLSHYVKATTLQGTEQVIPLGPAASQSQLNSLAQTEEDFLMPTVHILLKIRLLFPTYWRCFRSSLFRPVWYLLLVII